MTPPGRAASMAVRQQRALQAAERRHVGRRLAPACVRPAAQRPEPGTGHVGDHPVERAGPPGGHGAVGHHHCGGAGRGRRRAHQPGPVDPDVGGEQPGAAAGRQPGEQPRLSPGPGAQVEPAVVAARARRVRIGRGGPAVPGRSVPTPTRASASAASWLASSCTAARPCRTSGIPRRVAAAEVDAERRPPRGLTAPGEEVGAGGQPGDGAQGDARADAVRGQRRLGQRQPGDRFLAQRLG